MALLDNNVGYWKFYWHYEAPGCPNPPNEPLLIETEGATVVANNYYGDFALIKLYDDPAEKWDVMPYYLGWDRSSNVPIGGSVIHHPMGDVKKIINPIGTVEEQSKAYYWCNHYAMISLKTHWKFNSGEEKIVEGGSSGSPFLNSNHKLMGHHTSVKSMGNQHGVWYEIEFSKLSWAWDADYCNPNSTKRLKDWLDPINTGAITVDGRGGCQKTIKLWKSLPKPMYHALQNIISKQIIESGANASYKAGMEIVLQDGFHAKAGSTFKASIEACNSSTSMAPPAPSDEPNDDDLNNIIFDINELQLYAFQIYPNPAKNELNISGTIAPTYVCIYNFTGQLLYETEHCAANMIISVSSLPSGIYFVKIVSENGITTKKVVVEN